MYNNELQNTEDQQPHLKIHENLL